MFTNFEAWFKVEFCWIGVEIKEKSVYFGLLWIIKTSIWQKLHKVNSFYMENILESGD